MMPVLFKHNVACCFSQESSTGSEEIFFGSDDGFVYQLGKGTSLDGDNSCVSSEPCSGVRTTVVLPPSADCELGRPGPGAQLYQPAGHLQPAARCSVACISRSFLTQSRATSDRRLSCWDDALLMPAWTGEVDVHQTNIHAGHGATTGGCDRLDGGTPHSATSSVGRTHSTNDVVEASQWANHVTDAASGNASRQQSVS